MDVQSSSRYTFLLSRGNPTLRLVAVAIVLPAYVVLLCLNEHYNEGVSEDGMRGTWTSRSLNVVFVEARVRKRHFDGDLWRDEMEVEQAAKYYWYKNKSPIYFYGRTCGDKVKGARLIVAKMAEWSVSEILEANRVGEFLLHLRFLIETYGWRIVTEPEKEQRYILIIDFENTPLRPFLTNWFGLYRLFRLSRPSVKAAPLSWSKTCLLNAPYLVQKIISYGKTIARFRSKDIIIPQSPEETTEAIRDLIGEKCLPQSFGGRNRVPVDKSDVELAFQKIVFEVLAAAQTQQRSVDEW